GKNRALPFSPETNVTVYASFLFSYPGALPAGTRDFASLNRGSGTGPTPSALVAMDSSGRLLVGKNSFGPDTSATTTPLTSGTTNLIVIAYKPNPGTNADEVDLWLNPALTGATNPPTPTLSTANGVNVAFIQSFYYLYSSSTNNSPFTFYMD